MPDDEELRVETIVVTAALIECEGRYLVTRRQRGVHLEGYWEFPGGKCGRAESLSECLERELREELAVSVRVGLELFTTTYAYAERRVELHFFQCELAGQPSPQLGQEMCWVPTSELTTLAFPPADSELIRRLTGATAPEDQPPRNGPAP
jgi:mutator protein MutT